MTTAIRRPVSQVRAGDLIALEDEGTVYVVCAISQPVGQGRRVELVDARTGVAAPSKRWDLYDAVRTVDGEAAWFVITNHADGSTETVVAGSRFSVPPDGPWTVERHQVEVDLLGRPGWETLRRAFAPAPAIRRAA